MSDFVVSFRRDPKDRFKQAMSFLHYYDDVDTFFCSTESFELGVTRSDDPSLWGPFTENGASVTVALCGRVAFEQEAWDAARGVKGKGGLACKAIYGRYIEGGLQALEALNGNFTVLLYDGRQKLLHIITDRCGMCLCFAADVESDPPVFGSHPDAVAMAAAVDREWDSVSLAEFLVTGRLSFPHTYYKRVSAVPQGCVVTFDLSAERPRAVTRRYFTFDYRPDEATSDREMGKQLADAFTKAMTRRTWPLLGRSALALSGGMDSRVLLSAIPDGSDVITFCCYDRENPEFLTAKAIAAASGAPFVPMRRSPDFYGENAEMGVRISGGMGNIANNHFLGIRGSLKELGIQNLFTGCYCDYVLKGLVMDKSVSRFTLREHPAPYQDEHYHEYCRFESKDARLAEDRERALIPESLRNDSSEAAATQIEHRRTFPLHYEADCLQRVVPQRVMGWYLPIVDNDVLDVHLRLSRRHKLNKAVFKQALLQLCNAAVAQVPNANTGVRVDAPLAVAVATRLAQLLRRRRQRKQASIYSDGSWPNWEYYLHHSPSLANIWRRPNPTANQLIGEVMGSNALKRDLSEFHGAATELALAMRLLTLKAWFDQREGLAAL